MNTKYKQSYRQLSLFGNERRNDGIDITEAPVGFYPILKDEVSTPNVCSSCDARQLCQDADWCLRNPCMSYRRKDKMPVVFKKKISAKN